MPFLLSAAFGFVFRFKTKYNSYEYEICFVRYEYTMDLDEIIKALANPTRREILAWLKTPEAEFCEQEFRFEHGVCSGKIFARAKLSQSTVSAHLAVLQKAGLVSTTKIGQWVFYKRNEEAIAAFLAAMRDAL